MRILVCPPSHFDVDYVINPWMEGQLGRVDPDRAHAQWNGLFEAVAACATIATVTPHDDSPDMCFTANAGLVQGGRVLPARFRMRERAAEEPYFAAWFASAGLERAELSGSDPFEGEGDALFQPGEPLLWAGYGVRTALATHVDLCRLLAVEVVSLRLVDPRFYHLDTCFAPLPGGRVLYYPAAFDERSQAVIEARIPTERRIAVSEVDAMSFSCNALCVGERLFTSQASADLRRRLAAWDFDLRIHPVDEFRKAGGGVKCLSLLLEQPAFRPPTVDMHSAIRTARIDLQGHLLDAGLLRRVLDVISGASGSFRIDTLDLAERKDQESRTSIRVAAPEAELLDRIVRGLRSLGAVLVSLD